MTQPTIIYFGLEQGLDDDAWHPKIYLRTLLYSTAARGQILSSMFLKVRRGETSQNFNIWVHGERELVRGSGLFISQSGVVNNHHFLLPRDGSNFELRAGHYVVEVFGQLASMKKPKLLFTTALDIDQSSANKLMQHDLGLYFDWGPDAGCYQSHIRSKPGPGIEKLFRDFLESNSALRPEYLSDSDN